MRGTKKILTHLLHGCAIFCPLKKTNLFSKINSTQPFLFPPLRHPLPLSIPPITSILPIRPPPIAVTTVSPEPPHNNHYSNRHSLIRLSTLLPPQTHSPFPCFPLSKNTSAASSSNPHLLHLSSTATNNPLSSELITTKPPQTLSHLSRTTTATAAPLLFSSIFLHSTTHLLNHHYATIFIPSFISPICSLAFPSSFHRAQTRPLATTNIFISPSSTLLNRIPPIFNPSHHNHSSLLNAFIPPPFDHQSPHFSIPPYTPPTPIYAPPPLNP